MIHKHQVHQRDQLGVTSIEYGLLAALIALAIVGSLGTVGGENGGIWDSWASKAVAVFRSVVR